MTTSRERHESAQYRKLKNGERTSKCQVFSFTVPEKPKKWTELAHRDPLAQKWDALGFFNISVAKYEKHEEEPFEVIENLSEKSQSSEKKLKGGIFGVFNIHSVAKHQKIEGGPLVKKFRNKISEWQKTWKEIL